MLLQDRRRNNLLTVSEELFTKHGYRNVSVQQIAIATGIATGTFYRYFPSKEALYSRVVTLIQQRAIGHAKLVMSRFESPMNQLKALYRFSTLGVRHSPILRGILTRNPQFTFPDQTTDHHTEWILSRIGMMIDEILLSGIKRRMFRTSGFRDLRGTLITLFTSFLIGLETDDRDKLLEDTLILVERGLRRRLSLHRRADRLDRRRERLTDLSPISSTKSSLD